MIVRHRVLAGIVLLLAVGSGIAIASSGGAPRSRTGAPAVGAKTAEGTCLSCHGDYTLNGGATLTLVNAPNFYVAGATYTFSVQIASAQTAGYANRVWSFELTAIDMATGEGVGTFGNVAGQNTQIISGTGQYASRRYIEAATDRISAVSPVQWQVQWTAPNPGVGSVGFFASGIAGDGSGGNDIDWVCTGSSVIQDVTPVQSATWGGVKALYR